MGLPPLGEAMSTKGGKRTYFGRVERKAAPGEAKALLMAVMSQHGVGILNDDCLIWPFARGSGGYAMIGGRLVGTVQCEHMEGPRPSQNHFAAHTCGKGSAGCFHPGHVTWKTKHENEADKARHGTKATGARHGAAKVSGEIVAAMREMLASGLPRPFIAISMRGVLCRSQVYQILNGQRWRLTSDEGRS